MIRDAGDMARKFNMFNREQLRNCHLMYEGVAQLTVHDNVAYGGRDILMRCAAKKPAVRRALSQSSLDAKAQRPMGSTWCGDSTKRERRTLPRAKRGVEAPWTSGL